MPFVIDEYDEVYEVLSSGTYREVEEGKPKGVVRVARTSDVHKFLARRVEAWDVVVQTLPIVRGIMRSANIFDSAYESDVVIPAIAKAWRKYEPDRGSWKAFVRRCVWNAMLTDRRLRRVPEVQLDERMIEGLLMSGEREVPDIVYILDRLPKYERNIIVLRFWLGMTCQEIADVMGYAKSGAWLRVKRAVEMAREIVDEEQRRDVQR